MAAAGASFHRVAAGDYETSDGRFRLYRLCDVYPPAWNVEDVSLGGTATNPHEDGLIIDGAATKRDAVALFNDWNHSHGRSTP